MDEEKENIKRSQDSMGTIKTYYNSHYRYQNFVTIEKLSRAITLNKPLVHKVTGQILTKSLEIHPLSHTLLSTRKEESVSKDLIFVIVLLPKIIFSSMKWNAI